MNPPKSLQTILSTLLLVLFVTAIDARTLDACVQRPPPTNYTPTCQILAPPADRVTLNHAFADLPGDNPSYPYAQITTPPVCYGEVIFWEEKNYSRDSDVILERRFVFQRPKYSRQIALPLIIWAHPNGGGDEIGAGVNKRLAEPALAHGFAFMSLEYRHPTASRVYEAPKPPPPTQNQNGESPSAFCAYDSTDIAIAIQFARWQASQLQIDRDNIFVVGQSRGSLALLAALMNDRIDPSKDKTIDYRGWSSKPSAIFLAQAQAQVTYEHDQIESLFMRALATPPETTVIAGKPLQFPLCRPNADSVFNYYCQYDKSDIVINPRPGNSLSALNELDNDDPPVWARYERLPSSEAAVMPVAMYVADAGADQTKALQENCYDQTGFGCLDVHHPNFGVQLRQKYLELPPLANRRAYVNVQYADTISDEDVARASANLFREYYCFFIEYRPLTGPPVSNITPTGDANRKKAVNLFTQNRRPGDPPSTTAARCRLSEAIPWDWRAVPVD